MAAGELLLAGVHLGEHHLCRFVLRTQWALLDLGRLLHHANHQRPLTALQDGADGANGVYKYGAAGFPTVGYAASNYWVDVVYTNNSTDTTKPTLTDKDPASGATGVQPRRTSQPL